MTQDEAAHRDDGIAASEGRLRILQAVSTVLDDPHGLVDAVLGSVNHEASVLAVRKRFGLDEHQAEAVLDMQFRLLNSVDAERIRRDVRELLAELRH